MKSQELQLVLGDILIVDDKPENLRVLNEMLTGKGYKIRKALDGNSALKAVQSSPPDLILLDIKMPVMDGYEVCKQIKNNPQTKEIPVIFFSALDEVNNKIDAFQVGGSDYITKPFQIEEVIARIESQLTIRRQKKLLQKEIKNRKRREEQLRQEIKKRREAEEIIYQSRALIVSILNSSLDGIAALQSLRDKETGEIKNFRFLTVNPVMAKLFGREREELTGSTIFKQLFDKLNTRLFERFVRVVEQNKTLKQNLHYRSQERDVWYQITAVKLGDGFAITIRDITKTKSLELTLERQAKLDSLTRIANRRSFDEAMEREWQRCIRESQPLALILGDVDHFKHYNDYYGHQMGDECLMKIAQAMQKVARRSTDLVARYGGEEFAVILPNTDADSAIRIGESIREQIEQQAIFHQESPTKPYVTISLGITSVVPIQGLSANLLLKIADEALYAAKTQGRDRLVFRTVSNES